MANCWCSLPQMTSISPNLVLVLQSQNLPYEWLQFHDWNPSSAIQFLQMLHKSIIGPKEIPSRQGTHNGVADSCKLLEDMKSGGYEASQWRRCLPEYSPSINIETDELVDDNGDSTSTRERVVDANHATAMDPLVLRQWSYSSLYSSLKPPVPITPLIRVSDLALRILSGFHCTGFHCTIAFSTQCTPKSEYFVYSSSDLVSARSKLRSTGSICSSYQKPPEEPTAKRPPCHNLKSQSIV